MRLTTAVSQAPASGPRPACLCLTSQNLTHTVIYWTHSVKCPDTVSRGGVGQTWQQETAAEAGHPAHPKPHHAPERHPAPDPGAPQAPCAYAGGTRPGRGNGDDRARRPTSGNAAARPPARKQYESDLLRETCRLLRLTVEERNRGRRTGSRRARTGRSSSRRPWTEDHFSRPARQARLRRPPDGSRKTVRGIRARPCRRGQPDQFGWDGTVHPGPPIGTHQSHTRQKVNSVWYKNDHIRGISRCPALGQTGPDTPSASRPTPHQLDVARGVAGSGLRRTGRKVDHVHTGEVTGHVEAATRTCRPWPVSSFRPRCRPAR